MKFLVGLILAFVMFCWFCCLVYMMAREKNVALIAFDLKHKWFYLVLFIVLTMVLVLSFIYIIPVVWR